MRLEAWLEGQHVGQFVFDEPVRFCYDPDAPATPVSLSLPRDAPAARHAAAAFLENLLPDHERARAHLASAYGARSTRPADLLAAAGGDIAGGLVLVPEGEAAPAGPAVLNPALERDVADRINAIKIDPDAWAPRGVSARFSLAGTQGKFALARIDDDWYWSNATVPSTHIVKPAHPDLRGLEAAEAAALTLAARVGVPAAAASVLHAGDQTAFLVGRFDRDPTPGPLARRLHAEDFAQALGVRPEAKYQVSARQAAALLATVDTDGSLVRAFFAQLVFNTVIANADAHAKNYSVLLRPGRIRMAPLYDAVPIALYPQFDQALAMRVAGARHPRTASLHHWRRLARTIALDEDEATTIVTTVAARISDLNDTAWTTLDDDQATLLRHTITQNTEAIARP
ncbi:MAG: HipA domain-containing protein [Micrococcales bacterium]|nr:HipA domain-containing protein [Micrococcales bacterium]MCL2668345.1 HipA domain-containing protein [Micrococcales bacterium]